jgi:bacterial/archaeal transporter family-2 protein
VGHVVSTAMSIALFVPVVLGVVAVLQATFNRHIARVWGLPSAALLNTFVALGLSVALLAYCLWRGTDTGLMRVSFDPRLMRSWWLLPGLFGFAIVVGLPWAVAELGALPVFVGLIGAQVLTSALWDRLIDGTPFTAPRVAGAVLAVVSVALANWK